MKGQPGWLALEQEHQRFRARPGIRKAGKNILTEKTDWPSPTEESSATWKIELAVQSRTSLVAQVENHLPIQGSGVSPWTRKMPPRPRQPAHSTTTPCLHTPTPAAQSPCSHSRGHHSKEAIPSEEQPLLTTARESLSSNQDPEQPGSKLEIK